MDVRELNREQLEELKGNYLCERDGVAWWDIANADAIVTDEEIFEHYAGTDFVNDDFSCSCGQ